jgi:hypothetical protein
VIKSLSRQIYKEGTSQPAQDGLEHMADAVGYLIEYLYPVRRTSINNNKQQTWSVWTT